MGPQQTPMFRILCPLLLLPLLLLPLGALAGGGGLAVEQLPQLEPTEVYERAASAIFVIRSGSGRQGSGVTIGPGLVVTNAHVVNGAASIDVSRGQRRWSAELVRVDLQRDLALLRVAGLDAGAVSLRPSRDVRIGTVVYAVGAPAGYELTISNGLFNGVRRVDGNWMVQTSAPISPGSSGGGLFDDRGRLVGLTAASDATERAQNLNFAVPVEALVELLSLEKERVGKGPANEARVGTVRCHFRQREQLTEAPTVEVVDSTAVELTWWIRGLHTADAVLRDLRGNEITFNLQRTDSSAGVMTYTQRSWPTRRLLVATTPRGFSVTHLERMSVGGKPRQVRLSTICAPTLELALAAELAALSPGPGAESLVTKLDADCSRGQAGACVQLVAFYAAKERFAEAAGYRTKSCERSAEACSQAQWLLPAEASVGRW